MADRLTSDSPRPQTAADTLKGWVMVGLTFIFVALYAAALTGWLKPLPDEKMIARLEPIIFVIVGYYFGRLPAQQNEKTLKEEIGRQTQKADAAQHAKEQAQQSRESLEEKVKNARSIITAAPAALTRGLADGAEKATALPATDAALRTSLADALTVLNS